MREFTYDVYGITTVSTIITVEAENEAEAMKLAIEEASSGRVDWDIDSEVYDLDLELRPAS